MAGSPPPRPTTGESRPPGPPQAKDRREKAPGAPRVYSGRQCPLGLNCSEALVTRAIRADDAGEPLEGTDDLAASPRLEILHEQQLKVPHGCPPRLSCLLVRHGGKAREALCQVSRDWRERRAFP